MQRPTPLSIDGVELVGPAPGRNLSPRAFSSPAVFDVEQRAIFARSWVHVADLCDVPSPGSYVTGAIVPMDGGANPVI